MASYSVSNGTQDPRDVLRSLRYSRRTLLKLTSTSLLMTSALGTLLTGCDEPEEESEPEIDPHSFATEHTSPEALEEDESTVEPDNGHLESEEQDEEFVPVETVVRPPDLFTWVAVNTDWESRNHKAQMTTQHQQGRLLLDTGTPEHSIEATIDLPAHEDEHYAGLFIRYLDEENFVHARYLEQWGNSEIEVFQRWNNEDRLIIFINFHQSVNGTVRKLRVATDGSQVAIYDNEELVGQGVTDVNGTLVGLGAFGDQTPADVATWADVSVGFSEASVPDSPEIDLSLHDRFRGEDGVLPDSPRPAEPGPGTWIVNQNDATIRLRHNMLRWDSAVGWNEDQIWTAASRPHSTIGALSAVVRVEGATHGAGALLSEEPAPEDPLLNAHGLAITTTEIIVAGSKVVIRLPGPKPGFSNRSVDHLLSVVPRPGGGAFMLACGGRYPKFPEAALIWVETSGLQGDLYAGLSVAPNTNVSVDDLRIVPADELPEGFGSRFGVALAADDFSFEDPSAGVALAGRVPKVGESPWDVRSGAGTVDVEDGVLRPDGQMYAFVEPGPGARTVEATFRPGEGEEFFGLILRADEEDSHGVLFGHFYGYGAWGLWADGEMIWSTGAHSELANNGREVRLFAVDDGQQVRVFVNDIDLMNESWIEVAQRKDTSFAGLAVEGEAATTVENFAIWPWTVTLNSAFDSLRNPPDVIETVAVDSFALEDGTDLDHWALESADR